MEEYEDIFSSPIKVPMHYQVKNPIDLTSDAPFPKFKHEFHSILVFYLNHK